MRACLGRHWQNIRASTALGAVSESRHAVATKVGHRTMVFPFKSLDALLRQWALGLGTLAKHPCHVAFLCNVPSATTTKIRQCACHLVHC